MALRDTRSSTKATETGIRTIDDTTPPFFASWTTSLINSDLDRLQSLPKDKYLRGLVKSQVIEDESPRLNPYMITAFPSMHSTYNIWPRNDASIGIKSNVELSIRMSTFGRILRESLLRPTQIAIRNYLMPTSNFQPCTESYQVREMIGAELPAAAETVSIGIFIEDLMECRNLEVAPLTFGFVEAPATDSLPFPKAMRIASTRVGIRSALHIALKQLSTLLSTLIACRAQALEYCNFSGRSPRDAWGFKESLTNI